MQIDCANVFNDGFDSEGVYPGFEEVKFSGEKQPSKILQKTCLSGTKFASQITLSQKSELQTITA